MPTENYTTKFKVDISDLKNNIKTANAQIKTYAAQIKNASAGMQKGEETADSLTQTHRITGLNQKNAYLFDMRGEKEISIYLTKVAE